MVSGCPHARSLAVDGASRLYACGFAGETEARTVLSPAPIPLIAATGPSIPPGATQLAFLPADDGEFFERWMELAGRHPGFPRHLVPYDTAADTWREAGEIKPGVRTPAILTAPPAR